MPQKYLKPALQEILSSLRCIRAIRLPSTQVRYVDQQPKPLQGPAPLLVKTTINGIINLLKREYKHSAISSMILNRKRLQHIQDLKLLQLNNTHKMGVVDTAQTQRALEVP